MAKKVISPPDMYPQHPFPIPQMKTEDIADPYMVLYYKENIESFRNSAYYLKLDSDVTADESSRSPLSIPYFLYPRELMPNHLRQKSKKKLKPNRKLSIQIKEEKPSVDRKLPINEEKANKILSSLQDKEEGDDEEKNESDEEGVEEIGEEEDEQDSMDEGTDYMKDYYDENDADDADDENDEIE